MPRTVGGRWYRWLTLISVLSLIPPVAWILADRPHAPPTGDAFYFHWQAALIANGSGWFISPSAFLVHHTALQSAEHPPLWVLVLALADVIGIKSFLSQRLLSCLVGAAAVFVTGLAGREVAGKRAGLIAAVIAAVYPNYWVNNTTGLSETLLTLLVAAVVLVAYEFLAPTWPRQSRCLGGRLCVGGAHPVGTDAPDCGRPDSHGASRAR